MNAHASRDCDFTIGTILGKGFRQALVHTVHSTPAFGTCACGKPFPKIVPMAKLDKHWSSKVIMGQTCFHPAHPPARHNGVE